VSSNLLEKSFRQIGTSGYTRVELPDETRRLITNGCTVMPFLFLDLCCLLHLRIRDGTKKRNNDTDTTAASASSSRDLMGPLETRGYAGEFNEA